MVPMFALAADREPEGHLPTLYVAPVVAAMSDPNMLWQPAIGSGLTEMLITDLVGLEKFEILESTGLDDLMGEIDWATRGWVAAVEGVAKGQWAGTDFMLFAKVLRFGSTEKGLKLPFGVRLGKTLALVQIDWRLVDVRRRSVVVAGHAYGEEKGANWDLGGGLSTDFFQSKEFRDSALGRATGKALAAVIEGVAKRRLPASSRVPVARATPPQDQPAAQPTGESLRPGLGQVMGTASGGVVVVSLGSKHGVKVGDRIVVVEVLETKDDAGKVIFTEELTVGEVVVDAVTEDRSKGRFSGPSSPKPGWIVKLT